MQKILAHAPSIAVYVQLSAAYETRAQDAAFLLCELTEAANQARVSVDELRAELGEQIILQNLSGYIKHTLLNEVGQWSVNAQNFPPTARMLAAYADANPVISVGWAGIPYKYLHPPPTLSGLIVYPVFLIAGTVTLLLSVAFFIFLARPNLMNSPEGFYLGLAAFLVGR